MHRNLGNERFGVSGPGWSSSGDKGHTGYGDHELKCLKHIGRKNSWADNVHRDCRNQGRSCIGVP